MRARILFLKHLQAIMVVFISGCGFYPGDSGYPYNMYDRDIDNLLEIMEEGDESGLSPSNIFNKEEDDSYPVIEGMWGNIRSTQIVKKKYVKMKAYYFVNFTLTDGSVVKTRIVYSPSMGSMNIWVNLLDYNE